LKININKIEICKLNSYSEGVMMILLHSYTWTVN
jgi:hypothetical protein